MMKKTIYLGLILNILIFTGCMQNDAPIVKKPTRNQEPAWLNDPYIDKDEVAAIGCARAHYDGIVGQKKLAVSNAIDEIAAQLNTTVENITLRKKNYSDGLTTSSTQDTTSLHSVEKVKLRTKIKAYFKKNNGDICAWVIQK